MQGKEYSDEFRKEVIKSCDEAKANGQKVGDVLRRYGIGSGSLSTWRKKFRHQSEKEKSVIVNVMRDFGVEPCDDEIELQDEEPEEIENDSEETQTFTIKINDEYHRGAVIVALVMSGYVVWETQDSGDYFINYE